MAKLMGGKARKALPLLLVFLLVPVVVKAFTLIDLLVVVAIFAILKALLIFGGPNNIPCANSFTYNIIIEEQDCQIPLQELDYIAVEFKPELGPTILSIPADATQATVLATLQADITDIYTGTLSRNDFLSEESVTVSGHTYSILKTGYPASLPPRKPGYVYLVLFGVSAYCTNSTGESVPAKNITPLSFVRFVPPDATCGVRYPAFKTNSQTLLLTSFFWYVSHTGSNFLASDLLTTPDGKKLLGAALNTIVQLDKTGEEYATAITAYNAADPSTNRLFIKNCSKYSPNAYKCLDCE